jgi:uncharacterized protein
MLALPKLLFLILVAMAIWKVFRWVQRISAFQAALRQRAAERAAPPGERRNQGVRAEEMAKCVACGVYVAERSARACGRPDCPYAPP